MLNTLTLSLLRVTAFWYALGLLLMFGTFPSWAEYAYARLSYFPFVPEIKQAGIFTAASTQWTLLMYWTVPALCLWLVAIFGSVIWCEVKAHIYHKFQIEFLKPKGVFCGVYVPGYSLGTLPFATVPKTTGPDVYLNRSGPADASIVTVTGEVGKAVAFMSKAEHELAENLLQLLASYPEHYAGAGHGVGLLEHTLNVVSEVAPRCTKDFRLPFLAALSHDVGKLITFRKDADGTWYRKGFHSRESARILATMSGFQKLPEMDRDALLLAIKYDHNPSKIPVLQDKKEVTQLAVRIISALTSADRSATAAEKERHLERLNPEDLLWQDFKDNFREVPVVRKGGKTGVANQINNPSDSPYVYLYEAAWRDAAISRLPEEVAASLNLTRRDVGKLATYTRILLSILRKEGVLLESYEKPPQDGVIQTVSVTEDNPLWDIQSGVGDKGVVIKGVLILKAEELWKVLNYRLGAKSPYPVQVIGPNGGDALKGKKGSGAGAESAAAEDDGTQGSTHGLKIDASADKSMYGLVSGPGAPAGKTPRRGGFGPAPKKNLEEFGLRPSSPAQQPQATVTASPQAETLAPQVATSAPPSAAPKPEPKLVVEKVAKPVPSTNLPQEGAPQAGRNDGQDSHPVPEMPAMDDEETAAALAMMAAMDPVVQLQEPDLEGAAAAALLSFMTPAVPVEPEASVLSEEPEAPVAEIQPVAPVDVVAEEVPAATAAPADATPPSAPPQLPAWEEPVIERTVEVDKAVEVKAAAPVVEPKQGGTPGGVSKTSVTAVNPKAASRKLGTAAPAPVSLSWTEANEGIAIADEAAVAKYPHLALSDKYYLETALKVTSGFVKAGDKVSKASKTPIAYTQGNPTVRRKRF